MDCDTRRYEAEFVSAKGRSVATSPAVREGGLPRRWIAGVALTIKHAWRLLMHREFRHGPILPAVLRTFRRGMRGGALCTLCLALTACSMVMDASYDTMQGAMADGMVEKGWIPEWTPLEATNLREVHDLDSNVSALAFNRPAATRLQLPDDCVRTEYDPSARVAIRRRWWPDEHTLGASYTHLRCAPEHGMATYAAIEHHGARVLFWRNYQ